MPSRPRHTSASRKPGRPVADPLPFYFLWCLVCTPEPTPRNVMPFESPEARRAWLYAHEQGTGHDSFLTPNLTANG